MKSRFNIPLSIALIAAAAAPAAAYAWDHYGGPGPHGGPGGRFYGGGHYY